MKKIIILLVFFGLLSTAGAAEILVSTANQLEDAVAAAMPGDTITVLDGVYDTSGSITMYASGTAEAPIVIRAQNIGMAEFTGESYFDFRQCAYVVLEGFLFTSIDETVVKMQACNNIRITRNTFRLQETSSLKWVIIQGIWNDPNAMSHHNRIDHNLFENKLQTGNCITVDGTPDPTYLSSQYDRIDHNHFRNVGPRATNEKETIRVGWSELSLSSGFTTIEYNLFEDCDGDPEIISVKTSDNVLRFNTFRRCQGTLSLRHGDRTTVEGNFFFGEGKPGTGGVRVYGDDHHIINNYFTGLTGNTWDAPITLTNGDYDGGGSLSRHWRINRAIVAHNTLVDNKYHIEIGFTNNGNYTKPPRDVQMWNNLVTGKQNELVNIITSPVNMQWQGNLMFPDSAASLGITAGTEEIKVQDPLLQLLDGLFKLSGASPAVDSAAAMSLLIADDLDGQQRDALPDIGADELSTQPVLRAPLTENQVGPFAEDLVTGIGAVNPALPGRSFQLLSNYPNPFNPATVIRYRLSVSDRIQLQIYDIAGRWIATLVDATLPAGSYARTWDAGSLASGIYLVRLQAGGMQQSRKIMLLR